MTISAGSRLGPYEIVAPLGAGGMGEVWQARDSRLDRDVAIKILPPRVSHSSELRMRFEREARTISQLTHPHICTLYDIGHENETSFLVMELLDGETLADRIANGPLPPQEVLKFGAQIAAALEKAHRHGVTHRDLKPGNVMLTKSGAKLLDFGLAKPNATAADVSPDGETLVDERKPLTAEGTVIGTVQYMSPEQLAGARVDHRSDIFALGTVLYEMVTGRRAFEGASRTSIVAAIMSQTPSRVADLQPLTPPALQHVIDKCLEKDPDDRWQSAHDVAEELKWIATAGSETGLPAVARAASRRRTSLMWLASMLVAISAAAVASYVLGRRSQPAPNFSFEVPLATSVYIGGSSAVISPDGSRLAFTARKIDGPRMVWVRPLDGDAVPVGGTEGAELGSGTAVAWSADSSSLFYYREQKAYRVPAAGGVSQAISDFGTPFGLTGNASGSILYAPGDRGLYRIDRGGTAHEATRIDSSKNEIHHVWPAFLPDGKHYLFLKGVRPQKPSGSYGLYVATIDGSVPEKHIGDVASRVLYAAPGYLLTARESALWAIPFDLAKLEITGDPISVADLVAFQQWTGAADFSVSQNGTLAIGQPAFAAPPRIITREGASLPLLPMATTISRGGSGRVLADGRTWFFSQIDKTYGTGDLWVGDLVRASVKRLTFSVEFESSVVPTADGKRVYFVSDRLGWPDVWTRDVASGKESLVVGEPLYQIPRDISPDGRYLLYTTQNEGNQDLSLARVDVTPVTRESFVKTPATDGDSARFSPDGRWVAYTSSVGGKTETYLRPFPGPGAEQQVSAGGGSSCRFSPDGTKIYFLSNNQLFAADFDSASGRVSEAQPKFKMPSDMLGYEPRGDGTFLVVSFDWLGAPPTRVITNWTRLLKR